MSSNTPQNKEQEKQIPRRRLIRIRPHQFNRTQDNIMKKDDTAQAEEENHQTQVYLLNPRCLTIKSMTKTNEDDSSIDNSSNDNSNMLPLEMEMSGGNTSYCNNMTYNNSVIDDVCTANNVVRRSDDQTAAGYKQDLRLKRKNDFLDAEKNVKTTIAHHNAFRRGDSKGVMRPKGHFNFQAAFGPSNRAADIKRRRKSLVTINRRQSDRLMSGHNTIAAALLDNPSHRTFDISSGNMTSALRQHMSKMASSILGQGDAQSQRRITPGYEPSSTNSQSKTDRGLVSMSRNPENNRINTPVERVERDTKETVHIAKSLDLSELYPTKYKKMTNRTCSSKQVTRRLINRNEEHPPGVIPLKRLQNQNEDTVVYENLDHKKERVAFEQEHRSRSVNDGCVSSQLELNNQSELNSCNGSGNARDGHENAACRNSLSASNLNDEKLSTQQQSWNALNEIVINISDGLLPRNSFEKSSQKSGYQTENQNSLTVEHRRHDLQGTSGDDGKANNNSNRHDNIGVATPIPKPGTSTSTSQFNVGAATIDYGILDGEIVSELLTKHSDSLSESLKKKLEVYTANKISEEAMYAASLKPKPIQVLDANTVVGIPKSLSRFRHLGLFPVTPPSIDDIIPPRIAATSNSSFNKPPKEVKPKTYEGDATGQLDYDDEVTRRAKLRVLRMRKSLPKKCPAKLCFISTLENSVTHREVKMALEKIKQVHVTSLQYDPIYIEKCGQDGYKGMWIFEISTDSDRKALLQTNKIRLKGEQVCIRPLDDVYMEEYRAFKMYNSIKQEQLQKQLTKPERKHRKR